MNMENTRFSPPAAPVLLPGLRAQPINHLSRGWGECPLDTVHKLLPFYGILRCSVYALEESELDPVTGVTKSPFYFGFWFAIHRSQAGSLSSSDIRSRTPFPSV